MKDNLIKLYKNHGTKIGSWEIWTDGAIVHSRACKVLGGKPVLSQYEAKPKNVGRTNETTAEQQAVLESISKAKLKRDKGYVDSLDKADAPVSNTLGLPLPMLAKPIDKVKPESIDWSFALVQPKLDGHRALYKDGMLYSRQGKVLENMDHILAAIGMCDLKNHHLDGELYIHGMPLQEVSRLIKKWRPESILVEYHIYDIVGEGHYGERCGPLNELHHGLLDPVLQPVETIVVNNMKMVDEFHEKYRAQGYEGTMLRHGKTPYRDGKRCSGLLKIKQFHDAEFKVVGYEEGKPYIKEDKTYQVPVWICETLPGGPRFNVTAHGNIQQKDEQWIYRDDYLREELTVRYHYLSEDGIPQLPVAIRWKEQL